MSDESWRQLNRANWDERVPIHRAAPMYDIARLHAGTARLNAIEEAELGSVVRPAYQQRDLSVGPYAW